MRILMLSQFYPPVIGGEEQLVRNLSRGLALRGHDVAVATLWQDGLPHCERVEDVTIYRLRGIAQRAPWLYVDDRRRHAPPLPDPEITVVLRRLVGKLRPDIVHAHNWLVRSYLPIKASQPAKLVLSLHDYSFVCATKKLIHCDRYDLPCSGPGLRKCLTCGSGHYGPLKGAITTLSNFAMGKIEAAAVDMFLPVSRATAAGNGLIGSRLPYEVLPNLLQADAPAGDDLDVYLSQLPSEPFLMYAGAAGAYKGLDVLLSAYAALAEAPPLVLLGYHTAEYQSQRSALPANVVALRDWPHRAVTEAWRRCLFAIVPSRWAETFGLVALEAMQAGRPVIASRIGGLPDLVIDRETGLLVPSGDAVALRDAMRLLISDPELRDRMGRSAQERARLFSADVVLPRLEAIYQSLVSSDASFKECASP